MTDRNGNTHAYAYDSLGRQTSDSVTTLGSGVDGNTRRYDTSYDTGGRVERVTAFADTGGATVRNQVWNVYNGLGQLTKQYQEHGGLATTNSASVQYAYSEMSGGNHSRLVSMTYPNGRVINYDYDGMLGVDDTISRVSRISETTNHTTVEAYSYLGLSTIVEQDRPQNSTKLSLVSQSGSTADAGDQYTGLDRFGRVVDQWWFKYSGSGTVSATLDRFQYAYDPNGNVLYKNNLGPGTSAASFSELYHANGTTGAYDALDRLSDFSRGTLSASVGGGLLDTVIATNGAAANVAASQSFGLDSLGNTAALTTNGTASQTRTADNQNELLTLQNGTNTAVSLTYDNNGNLLTDEAGQTYVYDPWNRLHSVSNASITRTFTYDGLHRGAVSVADTSGSTSVRELYYSNDWQVIEEREDAFSSTAPLEQNIWGLGYVDNLVRRDRYYNPADPTGRAFVPTEHLWVQQDANHNVTSLADDTGSVKLRLVYDPYGKSATLDNNWSTTTDSYEWKYTHQGLRTYTDVGLIDNRERYYRPTLQRFVQQDPLKYVDGSNLYRPLRANPIRFIDPRGTDTPGTLANWLGFHGGTVRIKDSCANREMAIIPEADSIPGVDPWQYKLQTEKDYPIDYIAIVVKGGIKYYKVPNNVDLTISCDCHGRPKLDWSRKGLWDPFHGLEDVTGDVGTKPWPPPVKRGNIRPVIGFPDPIQA